MKTLTKTTSQLIVEFLAKKDFVFGGTIEDHIRAVSGAKGSTAARMCRDLQTEGILEHDYLQINGRGRPFVRYKLGQQKLF